MLKRNPSALQLISQALADEEAIAEALNQQGNSADALETARTALARAQHVSAPESERDHVEMFVGRASGSLAAVQAGQANWRECRSSAERAVAIWRRLSLVNSGLVDRGRAVHAEALFRECGAHLE
jgi:hypothetical protein